MTNDLDLCEVCRTEKAETIPSNFDGTHQICPRCGEFKIHRSVNKAFERGGLGVQKRALLSGWVHEQNCSGAIPTIITSQNYERILSRPLPTVANRARNLLIEAARNQSGLDLQFDFSEPRYLAATYSSDESDLLVLMRILGDQGLIENQTVGTAANILPQGIMQLEEIKMTATASSQGFIAMWFHDDMNAACHEGFEKGIERAGYDPRRVDQVEHINKIDDEIIAQIKASKFVVADFTGHRGGVYFEAGFALGLDIPVFWTCRQDNMDDLHFDIRQFNCINWETPAELAERLSKRIEAVVGLGPMMS